MKGQAAISIFIGIVMVFLIIFANESIIELMQDANMFSFDSIGDSDMPITINNTSPIMLGGWITFSLIVVMFFVAGILAFLVGKGIIE